MGPGPPLARSTRLRWQANYMQAITGSAYTASTKPATQTSPAGNVTESPRDAAPVKLGSGALTLTVKFSPLRLIMSADGFLPWQMVGAELRRTS